MTKAEQLRHAASIYEAHSNGQEVQIFRSSKWQDFGKYAISEGVKDLPELAPHLWRIAPKPVTRAWNCPADVPMPVCWSRKKGVMFQSLITSVDEYGCYIVGKLHSWDEMQEREHSTDGVNFKPCTVEVKQ